jgi:hypothetical protein
MKRHDGTAPLDEAVQITLHVLDRLQDAHNHGVVKEEVRQVMVLPGQDYPADRNTRMKLGQTGAGRYRQVIYVPDKGGQSAFVITAYELKGKALKAYRRQQRRKPR